MRRLSDLDQNQKYDLVVSLADEKARIFALVMSDKCTYFWPEGDREAERLATNGLYELKGDQIVDLIEIIEKGESVLESCDPYYISPEGDSGRLIEVYEVGRDCEDSWDWNNMSFHFSRIMVDEWSAEAPELKRTRNDAIGTAINAFLDECRNAGKSASLDECWRFAADHQSIDVNLDGQLTYPIGGGKQVKTCNRKQLSGRLKRAIRNRK